MENILPVNTEFGGMGGGARAVRRGALPAQGLREATLLRASRRKGPVVRRAQAGGRGQRGEQAVQARGLREATLLRAEGCPGPGVRHRESSQGAGTRRPQKRDSAGRGHGQMHGEGHDDFGEVRSTRTSEVC